jgi:hypothetical protein
MRILCYVQPWCAKHLELIATGISSDAELIFASIKRGLDQCAMAARYYELVRSSTLHVESPLDADTIRRCRILRSLQPDEASRHVWALRAAVSELLDRYRPLLVVSETTDSFVIDVLQQESAARGIEFVGLAQSFVNGYVRVTARGEHRALREPGTAEVDSVLTLLRERTYQPGFVKAGPSAGLKRWARNVLRFPYFVLRRRLSGEPYNSDYWAGEIVSRRLLHPIPRVALGDEQWASTVRRQALPVVYVPLQQDPEATIDYWCDNERALNYEQMIVEVIDRHAGSLHFLVKEHPNVIGFRHPGLYKKLERRSNVTICPTGARSNSVLEEVDAVMVWTGSVGFEAALRGLPVLTVCTPYYAVGSGFFRIDQARHPDEVRRFVDQNPGADSKTTGQLLVTRLLSGLVPGSFRSSWSWSERNPHDARTARELGYALAGVFGGSHR